MILAAHEHVFFPSPSSATQRIAHLMAALDDFRIVMHQADVDARLGRADFDSLVPLVRESFDHFCAQLTRCFGADAKAHIGNAELSAASARVHREFMPYLMLGQLVGRIHDKPPGYAGDFETIEWIYRSEPGGLGILGPLMDVAALERPAARAVRNRRGLLAGEIQDAIGRAGRQAGQHGQAGQVTSLACGPAQEVFDVFESLADRSRLKSTMVDIDFQALSLVADRAARARVQKQVRCVQANLVQVALGREQVALAPQDLIYSIGLIDYFEDHFVVALLDWIHAHLRPGGQVILGNFHPDNPDRALQEHILDWRLIHRSEADMERIFRASRFGGCSDIRFEPERVNLFAKGTRAI